MGAKAEQVSSSAWQQEIDGTLKGISREFNEGLLKDWLGLRRIGKIPGLAIAVNLYHL